MIFWKSLNKLTSMKNDRGLAKTGAGTGDDCYQNQGGLVKCGALHKCTFSYVIKNVKKHDIGYGKLKPIVIFRYCYYGFLCNTAL